MARGGGDLRPMLDAIVSSLKLEIVQSTATLLVAMMVMCETRIRYICILIQLISGDLVGGVEEGGEFSDRWSHE
jgi:hypothetical protein